MSSSKPSPPRRVQGSEGSGDTAQLAQPVEEGFAPAVPSTSSSVRTSTRNAEDSGQVTRPRLDVRPVQPAGDEFDPEEEAKLAEQMRRVQVVNLKHKKIVQKPSPPLGPLPSPAPDLSGSTSGAELGSSANLESRGSSSASLISTRSASVSRSASMGGSSSSGSPVGTELFPAYAHSELSTVPQDHAHRPHGTLYTITENGAAGYPAPPFSNIPITPGRATRGTPPRPQAHTPTHQLPSVARLAIPSTPSDPDTPTGSPVRVHKRLLEAREPGKTTSSGTPIHASRSAVTVGRSTSLDHPGALHFAAWRNQQPDAHDEKLSMHDFPVLLPAAPGDGFDTASSVPDSVSSPSSLTKSLDQMDDIELEQAYQLYVQEVEAQAKLRRQHQRPKRCWKLLLCIIAILLSWMSGFTASYLFVTQFVPAPTLSDVTEKWSTWSELIQSTSELAKVCVEQETAACEASDAEKLNKLDLEISAAREYNAKVLRAATERRVLCEGLYSNFVFGFLEYQRTQLLQYSNQANMSNPPTFGRLDSVVCPPSAPDGFYNLARSALRFHEFEIVSNMVTASKVDAESKSQSQSVLRQSVQRRLQYDQEYFANKTGVIMDWNLQLGALPTSLTNLVDVSLWPDNWSPINMTLYNCTQLGSVCEVPNLQGARDLISNSLDSATSMIESFSSSTLGVIQSQLAFAQGVTDLLSQVSSVFNEIANQNIGVDLPSLNIQPPPIGNLPPVPSLASLEELTEPMQETYGMLLNATKSSVRELRDHVKEGVSDAANAIVSTLNVSVEILSDYNPPPVVFSSNPDDTSEQGGGMGTSIEDETMALQTAVSAVNGLGDPDAHPVMTDTQTIVAQQSWDPHDEAKRTKFGVTIADAVTRGLNGTEDLQGRARAAATAFQESQSKWKFPASVPSFADIRKAIEGLITALLAIDIALRVVHSVYTFHKFFAAGQQALPPLKAHPSETSLASANASLCACCDRPDGCYKRTCVRLRSMCGCCCGSAGKASTPTGTACTTIMFALTGPILVSIVTFVAAVAILFFALQGYATIYEHYVDGCVESSGGSFIARNAASIAQKIVEDAYGSYAVTQEISRLQSNEQSCNTRAQLDAEEGLQEGVVLDREILATDRAIHNLTAILTCIDWESIVVPIRVAVPSHAKITFTETTSQDDDNLPYQVASQIVDAIEIEAPHHVLLSELTTLCPRDWSQNEGNFLRSALTYPSSTCVARLSNCARQCSASSSSPVPLSLMQSPDAHQSGIGKLDASQSPEVNIMQLKSMSAEAACHTEWFIHSNIIRILFTILVYVCFNASRGLLIFGLRCALAEQIGESLMVFEGTCDEEGRLFEPIKREQLYSEIVKFYKWRRVLGVVCILLALGLHVPYLWTFYALQDKIVQPPN